MQILLCAATEIELEGTATWLKTYTQHQVQLLITGVGLMAATYSITRALQQQRYHLVLQAGVAGSFHTTPALGTVVCVAADCVGDEGVWEGGRYHSLFNLGLNHANRFPMTEGKMMNPHRQFFPANMPFVQSVTVNEITTRTERIGYYTETIGAAIEAMEGAALHYVCLMEDVPFLQLRSISNKVGERNKARWQMPQAIAQLNTTLQDYLLKL